MTRKSPLPRGLARTALGLAVLLVAAPAFAQGAPGGGHGGGHGGGPPDGEESANNLSVPGIYVAATPTLNFPCGAPVNPSGTPFTGYPINPGAYYYVQGLNTWQASCATSTTAVAVTAAWGDNLTGDARLKTNSPIRVEVGLLANNPTSYNMTGWDVLKLNPDALDRESPYGTPATGSLDTGFTSTPITPYTEVRVYDGGAQLRIYNKDTGVDVFNNDAPAEINSTGRIVYGYNLRVTTAGTYVIVFTAPNLTITGADAGTFTATTVTLEITVSPGGSGRGGGRGGGGPPA